MKTLTTLDTISEAYSLIDELGLGDVLLGKSVELQPTELLRQLLAKKKLQEFISIITGMEIEAAGKLSIEEAAKAIGDFFMSMGDALRGLPMLLALNQNPAPTPPQTPKTKAKPKAEPKPAE